jgi:hypothetical protein
VWKDIEKEDVLSTDSRVVVFSGSKAVAGCAFIHCFIVDGQLI